MCDSRVFERDLGGFYCPQQPECDECFRYERRLAVEGLKDIASECYRQSIYYKEPKVPRDIRTLENPISPPGTKSVYELTLTSPVDDPYSLRQYLSKVVKSRMFDVILCVSCIELTEAGMPHIHALLYTSRPYLDASKIKTSIKFPHRFELKIVRSCIDYINYLFKEKNNPLIIEYCNRKGVSQFQCQPEERGLPDAVLNRLKDVNQ